MSESLGEWHSLYGGPQDHRLYRPGEIQHGLASTWAIFVSHIVDFGEALPFLSPPPIGNYCTTREIFPKQHICAWA